MKQVLVDHGWPTDPKQHVWGPWFTKDRNTQYRTCVHPLCSEIEERRVS